MKRILYQVDAFTRTRFSGNPAGVVTNAEGLSEQQMQSVARELNNSETAFISRVNDPSFDVLIRYFTPSVEVPVCGHATIASGYAIWREKMNYPNPLRIKTGAGILSLELQDEIDRCKVSMVQGEVKLGRTFDSKTRQLISEALGLGENDLDSRCPIATASTGHSKVMIGILTKSLLDSLSPNMDLLREISKEIECNGYYVFTFDSGEKDILVAGRMFAPAIGITEDPVTGNANGPLGAYLIANKLVSITGNEYCFVGKQGEAIGRKGYVEVRVEISKTGKPEKVTITGEAIEVFRTEIDI